MTKDKTQTPVTLRHRVIVTRSTKHTIAQLISDDGKTVATVSDQKLLKMTKVQKAQEVGRLLAAIIEKKQIAKVVFDRRQFHYHGRVQAVADGLREGGVKI